jgi:NAD(P)H-hydrate epimerase
MLKSSITTALTTDELKKLELQATEIHGLSGVILMENAGRCAAEVLLSHPIKGRAVICCGPGNNGGDGFVVARYLDNHAIPVEVVIFAEPHEIKGEAKIHYDIIAKLGVKITHIPFAKTDEKILQGLFSNTTWIVDAIFGTGFKSRVRFPFDKIISAINNAKATILAVDVPSGLDCDTGMSLGHTVHAHYTVTFSALKKGFANPNAELYLGEVKVADIGISPFLLQPSPKHL